MMELESYISEQGWTQREAAEKFGVTQSRVSDLMRGRIELLSIDALVSMSAIVGSPVRLQIGRTDV